MSSPNILGQKRKRGLEISVHLSPVESFEKYAIYSANEVILIRLIRHREEIGKLVLQRRQIYTQRSEAQKNIKELKNCIDRIKETRTPFTFVERVDDIKKAALADLEKRIVELEGLLDIQKVLGDIDRKIGELFMCDCDMCKSEREIALKNYHERYGS